MHREFVTVSNYISPAGFGVEPLSIRGTKLLQNAHWRIGTQGRACQSKGNVGNALGTRDDKPVRWAPTLVEVAGR